VGDRIAVFPSGREAKIERIVTFDGDLDEAVAPLSVTLVLDRELDISRGDLIAGVLGAIGARGGAQLYRRRWCGWISGRSTSIAATC
jgi:hypothetical protein